MRWPRLRISSIRDLQKTALAKLKKNKVQILHIIEGVVRSITVLAKRLAERAAGVLVHTIDTRDNAARAYKRPDIVHARNLWRHPFRIEREVVGNHRPVPAEHVEIAIDATCAYALPRFSEMRRTVYVGLFDAGKLLDVLAQYWIEFRTHVDARGLEHRKILPKRQDSDLNDLLMLISPVGLQT